MFSFFCILYFDLCRGLCVFLIFCVQIFFVGFLYFLIFYFYGFVVLWFFILFFLLFLVFFCLFVVLCFFYDLYKSTVNMKIKKSYFRIHLLLLGITDWCDDYILLR